MVRPRADIPAWLDLPRLARTTPIRGWQRYAACTGQPDSMFFHLGGATPKVREMCNGCPVRYACLAHTLDDEGGAPSPFRFGHRAATTPAERRLIYETLKPLRRAVEHARTKAAS